MKRQDRVKAYRSEQAKLAIYRDNALCAIHFFSHGVRRPYEEVHHVFGRGRDAGDWREHVSSLLCVCRQCHPAGAARAPNGPHHPIIRILRKANTSPINEDVKGSVPKFEENPKWRITDKDVDIV